MSDDPCIATIYHTISSIEDMRAAKVRRIKKINSIYKAIMVVISFVSIMLGITIFDTWMENVIASFIFALLDILISNFTCNYISIYSGQSKDLNTIKMNVTERNRLYKAVSKNSQVSVRLYNDNITYMRNISTELEILKNNIL